jgi:hypothetical protein
MDQSMKQRKAVPDAALSNTPNAPFVWVVDNRQWDRACLRAELIARGFDAVGYEDPAQAIAALGRPGGAKPRAIVLELRGMTLRRSELASLARLGVPLVALGGMAELNEEEIRKTQWAAVLRRPFTIGDVAEVVGRMVHD